MGALSSYPPDVLIFWAMGLILYTLGVVLITLAVADRRRPSDFDETSDTTR